MSAPVVGQNITAQTRLGTKVRIEVTLIEEEGPRGWDVWGYRVGKSSYVKKRARRSSYPNLYFVPRESV